MARRILLLLLLLFSCCYNVSAQEKIVKKDSAKVYKNIEKYSKKRKFTKFLHKLLFRTTKKSSPSKNSIQNKYILKRAFDKNEGKIIRKINVITLDPFGYSVTNKQDIPRNSFEKFGNGFHLKSKEWSIKNLLLIKKNEPLDSLLAKESERLVRRQRRIRSVLIEPIPIANSKDSVDISVRVLDSWSLIPTGSISSSRMNLEVTERNFFGLGHELEHNYSKRFNTNTTGNSTRYTVNNIVNTFANATLFYENDPFHNTRKSVKLERIFYSPLAHWAGGILLENRFYRDSLPDLTGDFENQRFKLETQDFWVGQAFKIFPGKAENFRTTNFVTTIRYQNIKYLETPSIEYNPSLFFTSERNYLASFGITTRKFAEEKYLFNYDIIEDVPYGQVYSITGGFKDKNKTKKGYFGARFAHGHYFNFGYVGTNIEWGSLFNNGRTEETTFRVDINYFTNIINWGNWKIRQFIKPSFVMGINRDSNIKDRININESSGISGFDSVLLFGTKKLIASFQTQTYSPGNWHGFHFNPYFNFSMGMIGNENNFLFDKKLYTSLGIGILINNDYLVFNSFQLSFAYYPSIPNEGSNIFKTNSFKNNDLTIPDYQIGAPTIVPYN
ncbi:hypothetical protein [Flavobacterium aquatile]|uniref:Outer membrane protein/protective antigen OMA87 n=1 Tax=Flavobacterium aquatile LMG 4008 = ATCC 11947 TaxID=1453498 RepID=A0A095SV65_9FLAO|nr:hypothetical protein [Flavobacterium aquatile]KGD68492.1 hypothetical protein LG45_09455 [Flavobacterium aquatile LMG 4008 = ATCC 11947]OXA68578.1 hypothetical protein B0A61_02385 [Flavobacterium aquatile LMG 4008 = ATCC 11947]